MIRTSQCPFSRSSLLISSFRSRIRNSPKPAKKRVMSYHFLKIPLHVIPVRVSVNTDRGGQRRNTTSAYEKNHPHRNHGRVATVNRAPAAAEKLWENLPPQQPETQTEAALRLHSHQLHTPQPSCGALGVQCRPGRREAAPAPGRAACDGSVLPEKQAAGPGDTSAREPPGRI